MSNTEKTTSKHPDEFTLLMYAERQLERDAAQEVSLHTQTCTQCLNLLRALDRESRLLTRSMLEQDEALPARLAEFHSKAKRSLQWLWALVFGLPALGVYALYTGYIEPLELRLEQAGFGGSNLLSLLVFQGAFWKGWQSMFTLVEFVALASAGLFGLFAIRRYLRRSAALAVMFASLGLLLFAARPVSGQTIKIDKRGEPSFELKQDEVRDRDLFFSGQKLKISGTVNGDIYTFAQQVEINGRVNGDILMFAQSARITGHVDGNICAFTNNITITGEVERSVRAGNETFTLEPTGKIGRGLLVFTKNMTLDGKMARDVRAFFAEGSVGGTIGGNFHGRGDSLTISSSAQIDGQTKFEGDNPADVSAEAKLASPLEFKKLEHKAHSARGTGYYIWKVVWAAAWILFGLILISLMPEFSKETVESAEHYGASFGLGVLVFFGVFIAALIACATIVGLLLGLSSLFLWIVTLFASYVVVGSVVGRWILGRENESLALIGRMAIGVLIVKIGTAIPYVGFWVMLGVWIWGMGAVSLALYRRLQPVMAPKIPPAPMAPVGSPLPPNTTVGGA